MCCGAGVDACGMPVCKCKATEIYRARSRVLDYVVCVDYYPVCAAHNVAAATLGALVKYGAHGAVDPCDFGRLVAWVPAGDAV